MNRSRAVIIFGRSPEAEALAKHLRVSRTAPVFEAVTAMWLRAAERANATAIVACAREDRRRIESIAPAAPRIWIEQLEGTFGARLTGVVAETFRRGFETVVVTGIDAPPPASLDDVFAKLESGAADAVIAPATDGGVNLIALTSDASDLLSTMRPRQRDAAQRCRDFFGARLLVLEASGDLDGSADLARALRDPAWSQLRSILRNALATSWRSHVVFAVSDPFSHPSSSRAPPIAR
jgi:glycosyltransferase A (GT-A) superfamily protein (DUF2064 family)